MQDIYFILSKLPVVIEFLFMLSRFVYPRNGRVHLEKGGTDWDCAFVKYCV